MYVWILFNFKIPVTTKNALGFHIFFFLIEKSLFLVNNFASPGTWQLTCSKGKHFFTVHKYDTKSVCSPTLFSHLSILFLFIYSTYIKNIVTPEKHF